MSQPEFDAYLHRSGGIVVVVFSGFILHAPVLPVKPAENTLGETRI
jgi:hypothetical protein